MKRLFFMDLKNYDENARHFRRPSVRAIILRDGKAAMVHSLKYDYYKFPGGGIEEGESFHAALIREVKEESGLVVIPDSIRDFGSVLRIQRGTKAVNEVFEQETFHYRCDVEETIQKQQLDGYEADEQFTLEFVAPGTAINVNRKKEHGPKDQVMLKREARVLELLEQTAESGLLQQ